MTQAKIQNKSQISNNKIKSLFGVIYALLLFCYLCFGICNLCFALDKIIAVVNNEIITQKDLDDFTNFIRIQLSADLKGKALEDKIESMRPQLLEKLIEDRLVLQEAKKSNVKIYDERVQARINEIKRRYPTDADFQNDLAKQGLAQADIENKIKEQMYMVGIVEQKIRDKIVVKPDEVTDFYNKNKKDFISQEERELQVIILDNENLAQGFAYSLKTGSKLVDLAGRYSVTVDRMRVAKGLDLRKDIEDVVFMLGVGEISNPEKIENKYYIFKLENIIPPRQQTLSEVQNKINAFLFEAKMQESLGKWLEELKKNSYIKIDR